MINFLPDVLPPPCRCQVVVGAFQCQLVYMEQDSHTHKTSTLNNAYITVKRIYLIQRTICRADTPGDVIKFKVQSVGYRMRPEQEIEGQRNKSCMCDVVKMIKAGPGFGKGSRLPLPQPWQRRHAHGTSSHPPTALHGERVLIVSHSSTSMGPQPVCVEENTHSVGGGSQNAKRAWSSRRTPGTAPWNSEASRAAGCRVHVQTTAHSQPMSRQTGAAARESEDGLV